MIFTIVLNACFSINYYQVYEVFVMYVAKKSNVFIRYDYSLQKYYVHF